jgi:hypothetical protein
MVDGSSWRLRRSRDESTMILDRQGARRDKVTKRLVILTSTG